MARGRSLRLVSVAASLGKGSFTWERVVFETDEVIDVTDIKRESGDGPVMREQKESSGEGKLASTVQHGFLKKRVRRIPWYKLWFSFVRREVRNHVAEKQVIKYRRLGRCLVRMPWNSFPN
jgi:hypothetical protein